MRLLLRSSFLDLGRVLVEVANDRRIAAFKPHDEPDILTIALVVAAMLRRGRGRTESISGELKE
jgi:hypothetical protein